MKTYGVVYMTTASAVVYVEAESPEEAEERADQIGISGLCHQESWSIDGDPEVSEVFEA